MRPTRSLLSALAVLATAGPALAQDEPATEEPAAGAVEPGSDQAELIAMAESAAPAAVATAATIHGFDANGEMTTLREGTNGWWCMPDDPNTPGVDPMCGDANTMDWLMAYVGHSDPTPGKTGFAYMLRGGSDASNTDPYASGPEEGNHWIETGRHVMVMNPPEEMLALYPAEPDPDTSQPYVMYAGTPYAHLMIPVE